MKLTIALLHELTRTWDYIGSSNKREMDLPEAAYEELKALLMKSDAGDSFLAEVDGYHITVKKRN